MKTCSIYSTKQPENAFTCATGAARTIRHMDFVFSDKTALDAVRFRHFMSDCRLLAGDNHEIETQLDHERRAALAFLKESHRDIMEHFDPTVVTLRKKRKIILADGKLKDLL